MCFFTYLECCEQFPNTQGVPASLQRVVVDVPGLQFVEGKKNPATTSASNPWPGSFQHFLWYRKGMTTTKLIQTN